MLFLIYDTFKNRILRKAKGLTQKYMAAELAIEQSEYQRIETGHRKHIDNNLMEKIANIFKVSVDDLTNEQPFLIVINNNHSANQNNAPFGNQIFEKDNAIIPMIENFNKLIQANLQLVEKISSLINVKSN